MTVTYSTDAVLRLARIESDGYTGGRVETHLETAQGIIHAAHGQWYDEYIVVDGDAARDDVIHIMPAPLLELQTIWINYPDNTKAETTNFTLDLTTGKVDFSAGSTPVVLARGDIIYARYYPRLLRDAIYYRAALDLLDAYTHADVDGKGGPSSVRISLERRLRDTEYAIQNRLVCAPVSPRTVRLWDPYVPG
jgi:hypothetical protein